jgi:hypothetical protein
MSLRLVPIRFGDAGGFTDMWHRHHRRPTGHVFSVGVANEDDLLVGVAMVGRPVAVAYQDGLTLEVNRTTTDGTTRRATSPMSALSSAHASPAHPHLIRPPIG